MRIQLDTTTLPAERSTAASASSSQSFAQALSSARNSTAPSLGASSDESNADGVTTDDGSATGVLTGAANASFGAGRTGMPLSPAAANARVTTYGEAAGAQRIANAHDSIRNRWANDRWGLPSALPATTDNLAMAKRGINPAYVGKTHDEMQQLRFTYGKEAAAQRIAIARQYRMLRWQAMQER